MYENRAPQIDKKIYDLGIPILGICYGMQLTGHLLKGQVKAGKIKEYGPAKLHIITASKLFRGLPQKKFQVWMSHGDTVISPPPDFSLIAATSDIPAGAMHDEKRKIYCVQFHPEVQHTNFGMDILKNFLNICGEKPQFQDFDIKSIIRNIKDTVGKNQVLMALSGGTDSFVAATLIIRAIGANLIPVYIDSGLMRENALQNFSVVFPQVTGIRPKIVTARRLFLQKLKKVSDPEAKRKTIGKLYVDLFEKTAAQYKNVAFLGQGTTYADFIHSQSTKYSALIKSHHNVGGLPKKMKLRLLEPICYFYTDQVRYIGQKLGLPKTIINQQPFPGPGFAVRILGEITHQRLHLYKQADKIVVEEIEKAHLKKQIFQYFAVLTDTKSTAIKGDGRFYGEVCAIRAYTTKDRMTADWAKIPYPVLQKISTRIVNEVPGISRVVYDITTKPPATMEWE